MYKDGIVNLQVAVLEQAKEDFLKWNGNPKHQYDFERLINELNSPYFTIFLPTGITGNDCIKAWSKKGAMNG